MPGKTGKNREDYKKNNRGLALQLIATGTCKTRSELTQAMGLSKMAISRIVSEMMNMGLLYEENPVGSEEPGRTAAMIGISPEAPVSAGLLIQREYCEAVICDLNLNVLRREKVFYGPVMNAERLMEYVYEVLDTVLFQQSEVTGIGVCSRGDFLF